MVQPSIEELLRQTIGLDAGTLGAKAVQQAVQARLRAGAARSEAAYAEVVRQSPAELNQLIEEVVVAETWFFRDLEPFRYLARHLVEKRIPGGPWRILSVACSSGEEPYSIAMTLLDAGLSPGQFHIDAVDISARALAKAKRAVYTKNSFRGEQQENAGGQPAAADAPAERPLNGKAGYRNRYFSKTSDGFQLSEEVRRCVNFYHGNAATVDFMVDKPSYDIIFCRNLLIYLDAATRAKIIHTLAGTLKDGGLLFVGHAETSAVPLDQFVTVNERYTFAFRKQEEENAKTSKRQNAETLRADITTKTRRHGEEPEEKAEKPKRRNAEMTALPKSPNHPITRSPDSKIGHRQSAIGNLSIQNSKLKTQNSPSVLNPQSSVLSLKAAAELADRGRLAEAKALCEKFMQQEGPSAEGYCLLGIIGEATGKLTEAEEYFNKAVYLDHDHAMSLTHLALLLERQGRSARAATVRRHAERVGAAGGER